jgi:hypothetical protein
MMIQTKKGGIVMGAPTVKAPWHLWVVGIVAVLWNAIGAFDYAATQLRIEAYMSQFTEEQLAYFYGFPAWAVAAWAIAVWSSLLASLALLFRKAWSAGLFGLAIVAMVITFVYNFVLSDGLSMMGAGGLIFTAIIWLIAFFLLFYARAMAKRGVLG